MPIADSELDKTANAHLVRPAGDTLYTALQVWRSTPNSYEWWWLVIDHGDAQFTALRFEAVRDLLRDSEQRVTMHTRLGDLPPRRENPDAWGPPLPGVVTPVVVEQAAMGTARALQIMRDSPGRVLVVVNQGQFRGILSGSERTFAFTDKPLLDMLDDYEQGSEPPGDDPASGENLATG